MCVLLGHLASAGVPEFDLLVGRARDHESGLGKDGRGPYGGFVARQGHDGLELVYPHLGGLVPRSRENGARLGDEDSRDGLGVGLQLEECVVRGGGIDSDPAVVRTRID